MAITPSDFSKIWASNADTPEYTFSDTNYLKGWDFVGNLPPTRAQWNAIQKSTDEKMKYVFDNFGAPLTASTVAEMAMQNRVYVYTGSETGYTAGHWYYWNGSAWTDGGVYNSVALSTDTTLTISGQAADAKATGDNIKSTKAEMSLFGVDDLLWDNTNPASKTQNGITFTVDKINKTVTIRGTATGGNAALTFFAAGSIPSWLQRNKKYYVHMQTDTAAYLRVSRKINGTWNYSFTTRGVTELILDSSVTDISIEIVVWSGNTINTVVRPFISDGMTVEELVASEPTSLLDDVVASEFDVDIEWTQHMVLDINNGTVYPVEEGVSCTEKMIEIPYGAKAYIHMAYGRVAKYDKDGVFIEAIPDMSTVRDAELDSGTVKYFRLSYPGVDIDVATANTLVRIVYPNGKVSHAEDIRDAENGELQTITASGNPVVITNTSARSFDALSLTNQTEGKNIVVCGKNLFTFYHAKTGLVTGGTTYRFNKSAGEIRVTSNGATAVGISANAELGDKFTTLNGIASFNNFKFVFPQDTYIAISGNCSVPQPYDYPVQLQLIDGTHTWGVGDGGICIKALANVEYGLRVRTMAGWSGDITFRPQVEIGTHPTEFEVFKGSVQGDGNMPLIPTTQGQENILNITASEAVKNIINNANANLTAWVDRVHNEITIDGKTLTSNNVVVGSQSKPINGILINCISTFTANGLVCVKGISEEQRGKARVQITDGTNFWNDSGSGVLINIDGTKTYAFRLVLYGNQTWDNEVFHVQVATGIEALKLYGSRLGTTTIYTNDSATIDVTATQTTRVEKVESSYNVTQGLTELTAGRILSPLAKFKKIKPMVTFIDDDTWSPTLVQRYHDVMAGKGVVGNYAVMTRRVDMYDNTTLDMLLEYETEGFGCLYHCYDQNGDETRYWEANNPAYDETLIKENFMRGLRRMAEYGFSAYNYWVTPYGVNDKFIVDLAKAHGMKCLFNCPTGNFYQHGYVSATGNADRWNISRPIMTLAGGATQDGLLHSIVDACVADKGWLTIVTHANSWGNTDKMDTRLANMVQYCLDAGMEVTSVPVAFETFYPVFLLNELL